MRIEQKAWGPAADAPTFLPADALAVEGLSVSAAPVTAPRVPKQPKPASRSSSPSSSRSKSDSIITSAPKQPVARSRNPSQSTIKPLPEAPSGPAPRGSSPSTPSMQQAAPGAAVPPYVQFEGGASFDPLAIPLPPELAAPVYDWLRRLALQADLSGADKLLREAFADLTSSLSCLIIYAGPDGLHTLGANDEMPKDDSPIVAVARSRRALCTQHNAYLPIATSTETMAVVVLTRNSRQPAYNMVDHVTMAGLARESASIMHHLVVQHLQRRNEAEHDKKGLYRPEALESHRRRGQEGVVAELSPTWVRRTYWVLLICLVAAIVFATWVTVPTYSTGTGIVVYDGEKVTAPAPGTVEKVLVQVNQEVHKGTLLVRLKADKEEADLRQVKTELDKTLQQYLFDRTDEQIRKQLLTVQSQVTRAEDALKQKNIYATADGVVADLRPHEGVPIEFGGSICTIIKPGTTPTILAYMPASDLPRFAVGKQLQVSLTNFEKAPEKVTITSVERSGISAAEAKRSLGPLLGEGLKLAPETTYVLVKASLPSTFRAKGQTYRYLTGMPAKTEIAVESKRFVVTLLPSLEKYVP
ncbi:MAG TPA: biotin/lipoyl-binding protein [Kofleriaceae bacterium]|nr:biotin/lipoyl-binding protein [Kofleriaceae bacterium]